MQTPQVRSKFVSTGPSSSLPTPDSPKAGKPPFLELLVAVREEEESTSVAEPLLVLRNSDGSRTAEHLAVREWTGLPTRYSYMASISSAKFS